MFDFIETMSGKVPEEIIDMFVNASEFHNGDPWAALRSCMIEYAKKNGSAQFDYSAMSAKERFLFYLKSLDLDLKMGYDLGTVCGYGRKIGPRN